MTDKEKDIVISHDHTMPKHKRIRGEEKKSGSMESLPSDILLDILSRVPTETVVECKLVCKRLGTLIHDSRIQFTNMHLSRQLHHLYGNNGDNDNISNKVEVSLYFACYIEEICDAPLLFYGGRVSFIEKYSSKEKLKRINHPSLPSDCLRKNFVGSCNGLICLTIHHHLIIDPIYIFNPVTREYVYLPKLVVKKEDVGITNGDINMFNRISSGFGYVSCTNEYKVVRIHFLSSLRNGHVQVYTLGSGCGWRDKGTISMVLGRSVAGTCANGAIYWIGEDNIVAFDLVDEVFRPFSLPPGVINRCHSSHVPKLVALGGRLCLYVVTRTSGMEIWSLKKTGTKETWCMDFDINFPGVEGALRRFFRPIVFTKNKEIIFIRDYSALYCYDPKTTTLKKIFNNNEVSTAEIEAIPHVNTFASLKAIGENSKIYMNGNTWEDACVD